MSELKLVRAAFLHGAAPLSFPRNPPWNSPQKKQRGKF